MTVQLRQAAVDDHERIVAVVDEWWDGRPMASLMQPLFLEHFASTSLVAEDGAGRLVGFLVGFPSVDRPDEAYVHFVGVHPDHRASGLGRRLHDRFAQQVAALGVRLVRCVTSPVNEASVRFHTSIGFEVDGGDDGAGTGDGDDGDGYVRMSRSVDATQPRFVARRDDRPDDVPFATAAELTWPIDPGTALVGAHVELRVADPEADGAELFAVLDDDSVWEHVRHRPTDPAGMVALLAGRRATDGWCPWVVRLRHQLAGLPSGAVVGTTSYLDVVPDDARGEIGATLYARPVWSSPVNPECKLLLMQHAFEVLGWGRVQLKTDVRNERSQQAIARLGARYEATLRRYQRRTDGTVRDSVLFSVIAEEWPRVRAGLRARLAMPPVSGRADGRGHQS